MGSLTRSNGGYRGKLNGIVQTAVTKKARVKITTRYLPCSFLVSTPWCETSLETAAGFVRTRKALGILIFPVSCSNKGRRGVPRVLTVLAEENRSCYTWVVYPLVKSLL